MSLRIDLFDTTCHVPPQLRKDVEIIDRLARGSLARDLGAHLGPSLARQPAIIRIRFLSMRVILPASELSEDALSLKWCHEFGKALLTALAYPADAGPVEVFRADSIAAFVALVICDLVDGTAQSKWQYAEFESFFRLGNTEAAIALICAWPQHSQAILIRLVEKRILTRLLARFEDLALERIFSVLALSSEADTRPLFITDLMTVARLLLKHVPDKAPALRSRAYALNLFVEARRSGQPIASPRAVFHALLALAVLLNEDAFWPGVPRGSARAGFLPSNVAAILETIAKTLANLAEDELSKSGLLLDESRSDRAQSDYAEIFENIGGVLRHSIELILRIDSGRAMRSAFGGNASAISRTPHGVLPAQLAELDGLLQAVRTELKIPTPAAKPLQVHWVSSDWCGLFFLSGTLERLDWISAWGKLPDFQAGGVGCLVAGLALTIAGKFDPAVPSLDPAIALFAGFIDQPDLAHARRVFREYPVEVRRRVLRAAHQYEKVDQAEENWQSTFELLAKTLLQTFSTRIRGFRQATHQGIVRSFIARPGRIRIDPDRLVIFPAPSPFNVALRISGMDYPVDPSAWLRRRRIEFEMGDM